MAALHINYLAELEEYFSSGDFAKDFTYSAEERRFEMLEFAEKLMDVAELADKSVTQIIFPTTQT